MQNEINKTGSKPFTPPVQPTDKKAPPATVKGTSAAHTVSHTEGDASKEAIPPPPSEEAPAIPKPTEEANLPEKEALALAADLQKAGTFLSQIITIDSHNLQALFKLADLSANISPNVVASIEEALGGRSPEENVQSLKDALLNNIDGRGNFNEEAKKILNKYLPLLEKPNFDINSIPQEDKEKAFSIFAILLLLNKLSSSQRALLFQSMQLEQVTIQATFVTKIDIIKNKAVTECIVTGFNMLAGGVSAVGAYFGGATGKNITGQILASVGRTGSEVVTASGKATVAFLFETKQTEVEAEKQEAEYEKGIVEEHMRKAGQDANSFPDTAKQVIDSITTARSAAARI